MTWFTFLLVVLAVYRLAHLVAFEDGPWKAGFRLRRAVYRRWPGAGKEESWQFAGITCPLCISWWLAWPAALWLRPPTWWDWPLYALAIAGAVMVAHKVLSKP